MTLLNKACSCCRELKREEIKKQLYQHLVLVTVSRMGNIIWRRTDQKSECYGSEEGTPVDVLSADSEKSETSGSQESVNFYRIVTLVVNHGTDVLLKTFYSFKPKKDVKEFFSSPETIKIFKDLQKRGILTKPQYDKLVVTDPDPDDYDISLLFKLLRNVFPSISPPLEGWKTEPADDDVSLSADILRLKDIRNDIIAHISKAQLNEAEFNDLWSQITKTLKRMLAQVIQSDVERSRMERKMDELKYKLLDVTGREQRLLNILKAWIDDDTNQILYELESLKLKVGNPAQNSDMQLLMQEASSISKKMEYGSYRQNEDSIVIKELLITIKEQLKIREPQESLQQDETPSNEEEISAEYTPVDTSPYLSQSSVEIDCDEIQATGDSMKDFVILHADADMEEACRYRDHLLQDFKDLNPPLEVEMFKDIDVNRTNLSSLRVLHDSYHYILIYVAQNLTKDRLVKYFNEILIYSGLMEEHKQERLIPVWAIEESEKKKFGELGVIKGFQYRQFLTNNEHFQDMYKRSVMTVVKEARRK